MQSAGDCIAVPGRATPAYSPSPSRGWLRRGTRLRGARYHRFQTGIGSPATGGRIGIVTAGSSDIPIAAEAALIAREMGCEVHEVRDVGVAGLHRLVRPLERLGELDVHVIIVAAGMDGALPSVVAGLVPVPVIGLPTSVGYGFGGAGVGAMTTMLQSCAPGLVVVNIDNGVGAGAAAAKIANVAAANTG